MKAIDYIWGILSAICFGALPIIGRFSLIETTAETILFIRFSLVCLIVLMFFFMSKQMKLLKLKKRHIPMMMLAGIAFSFETIGYWIALGNIEIIPLLAIFWTFPMISCVMDMILNRELELKLMLLLIIGSLGTFLATGVFNV